MFNSAYEPQAFETDAAIDDTDRQTPALSNEAIAEGLEAIAELLSGDDRNRVRREALGRAASLIRTCRHPVAGSIVEAGLEAVHELGINYALSGIVTDWVRSGRLAWLEQLRSKQREELTRLPGIGPRLASELREVLGVVDLDGLAEVAREGRLEQVCGFGPKRLRLVTGALAGRAARGARRSTTPRQLPLLTH